MSQPTKYISHEDRILQATMDGIFANDLQSYDGMNKALRVLESGTFALTAIGSKHVRPREVVVVVESGLVPLDIPESKY